MKKIAILLLILLLFSGCSPITNINVKNNTTLNGLTGLSGPNPTYEMRVFAPSLCPEYLYAVPNPGKVVMFGDIRDIEIKLELYIFDGHTYILQDRQIIIPSVDFLAAKHNYYDVSIEQDTSTLKIKVVQQ